MKPIFLRTKRFEPGLGRENVRLEERTLEPPRVCKHCGRTRLSIYNNAPTCWSCKRKIQRGEVPVSGGRSDANDRREAQANSGQEQKLTALKLQSANLGVYQVVETVADFYGMGVNDFLPSFSRGKTSLPGRRQLSLPHQVVLYFLFAEKGFSVKQIEELFGSVAGRAYYARKQVRNLASDRRLRDLLVQLRKLNTER